MERDVSGKKKEREKSASGELYSSGHTPCDILALIRPSYRSTLYPTASVIRV